MITSPAVGVRSIAISVSVCLFVCLSVCSLAYLNNHTSKFHQIFCTCYRGRGSILYWRQCDCYVVRFMDDVIFSDKGTNGQESKMRRLWFWAFTEIFWKNIYTLTELLLQLESHLKGKLSSKRQSTYFAQISKTGTVTKGIAWLANWPFLVFDFRALWRSILSSGMPESWKLKMFG